MCSFCGGFLSVECVRFGFYASQCADCDNQASGFIPLVDSFGATEGELAEFLD